MDVGLRYVFDNELDVTTNIAETLQVSVVVIPLEVVSMLELVYIEMKEYVVGKLPKEHNILSYDSFLLHTIKVEVTVL